MNVNKGKLIVDFLIAIVFALLVLLYIFLLLDEISFAFVAFLAALAISLGARAEMERRRNKRNLLDREGLLKREGVLLNPHEKSASKYERED